MTDSFDLPPYTSDGTATGNAFAAALDNPEFRRELWCLGLGSGKGHMVVTAAAGDPLLNVLDRVPEGGGVILAVPDESARFGWRLTWVEVPGEPLPAEVVAAHVAEMKRLHGELLERVGVSGSGQR